jgi:hypothetical protein
VAAITGNVTVPYAGDPNFSLHAVTLFSAGLL